MPHFSGDYYLTVDNESMDNDFFKATGGARKLSYNTVAEGTNNFSDEGKLGEGGFGPVYKGFLKKFNCFVAVKKVSRDSRQGKKEYAYEVKIISQSRHRNIVKLIGWCHEKDELILVYEFMPNGSLDSHLFKEKSLLTWEKRYEIALGVASGLHYLHEGLDPYVVHRDIKASNIMLDSDFNPKIGDFGLARLADGGGGKGLPHSTVVAGTPGYMAPEYANGRATKEADVYSFGIVALEIACGRKINDQKEKEDQTDLRKWVWGLYGEGKVLEAVDPRLNGDFDKKQAECLMIVGLWCAHPHEKSRPTMEKAIHVLKFLSPIARLPLKMPSFDAPLILMSSGITDFVEGENGAPTPCNITTLEEGRRSPDFADKEGDQNFVSVYKMELHCLGCAKKARKVLKRLKGVELVVADCKANELRVKGSVDPLLIKFMLEKERNTTVQIVERGDISD